MISNTSAALFIFVLFVIVLFTAWSIYNRKRLSLLHKLYLCLVLDYAIWDITMLGMWLTPPGRTDILQLLDSFTYLGIAVPSIYLMISLVIAFNYERFQSWMLLFLVVPCLSFFVCLTNNWHHLQYKAFSIVRSEIVFGPYVLVTGLHSYISFLVSFYLLIRFARKNRSRLYIMQCSMLVLGGLCPMIISIIVTFSGLHLPITLTPLSFLPILLFNGIAIYRFRLLDITPVATQQVLDWISDCYLILSSKGLVISYNKPFASVFASRYGIMENRYLTNCVKEEDISKKTAIYNMITAVQACQSSNATISYEQPVTVTRAGIVQKYYYLADVTQLIINQKLSGFVVLFKDITQLKKSMQQLQENQTRMMDQERFAFLGQMMGGLAHNLKTPIMSISGCVSAADSLLDECHSSLDDPKVTPEDYHEIYTEMRDWFHKIQESTAYMSDIISAIKGQATSVGAFDESIFTLDELFKRTTLLMRHELVTSGCSLVDEHRNLQSITLRGDINNLVQVVGNLVSNAIHSQMQVGGGAIRLCVDQFSDHIKIYIKDTGPGIPASVRNHLFREMATSKGTQGSGLGLYISNAVVQGKFNGTMWCQDNPGGGAIFGMTIPLVPSDSDRGSVSESSQYSTPNGL